MHERIRVDQGESGPTPVSKYNAGPPVRGRNQLVRAVRTTFPVCFKFREDLAWLSENFDFMTGKTVRKNYFELLSVGLVW